MQDRAFANDGISFVWNSVVDGIVGEGKVEGVRTRNVLTDEKSTLDVTGIFVAIGHKPNTDLFKGQLEMDGNGYLVTGEGTATNVEGVFASQSVLVLQMIAEHVAGYAKEIGPEAHITADALTALDTADKRLLDQILDVVGYLVAKKADNRIVITLE